MDAVQTGKFILELRKQKGLTQKELAEKLAVTDKAISRWETGKGFPDTALLKPLSELLGVSVGELLAGEHIREEQMKERTDRVILDSLNYSRKRLTSMVIPVLIVLGLIFLLLPFYAVLPYGMIGIYAILGYVLIVITILCIVLKAKRASAGRFNRTLYVLAVLCQAVALCLEFLPFSAISHYFAGPNDTFIRYHSYFSIIAFFGGNMFFLPAGLMTIAVLILSLISLIRYKKAVKTKNAAFICGIITLALSLVPLVFMGGRWMTSFSYAVSGLLLLSIALQAVANRNI